MKSLKPRRRVWLGLLLAPPAFWALILAVVPTDWARSRLVARLEQATSRPVRLGAVRLGVLGGVRLQDLEIGEAQQDQAPWLRVETLRVDLNLAGLLLGHCEPSDVEADGVRLRVHRRRDGTFEFGDLLRAGPAPAPAAVADTPADPAADGPAPVQFRLTRGTVSLIDEPSGTRLEFADVEARGMWQRQRAAIQELKGGLNGGTFALAAQLDRGAEGPAFEGQLDARGVGLGAGMDALGYLVPVLAGVPAQVEGRLDLSLDVRGRGTSAEEVARTLVGHGTVALDPIRLDGSRLVADLERVVRLPAEERVGSVRSSFEIGGGRITSKDLTLMVARVPIPLAGWTDFRGRIDYRVRADSLAGKLPAGVQGILSDLSIAASDLTALRVQGTVDAPTLSFDGAAIGEGSAVGDERGRLRELTRRLRHRILR